MSADPLQWRGVAAEEVDEVSASLSSILRSRSRRLLGELVAPHRRRLALSAFLVAVFTGNVLLGPYLVQRGIDDGIGAIRDGRGATVLVTFVALFVANSVVQALAYNGFVQTSGVVAQDVLLALRRRVFDHFQRLSVAFHERYTSGRVISRLTSDVDAISELFAIGLETLVSSALLIVGISVVMLLIDLPLALVALVILPGLYLLTRWFRSRSELAYRATRESIALVIVHFVETLGGIRAVHAFRREPRNEEIFRDVNHRYRDANTWSFKLAGTYGPGIRLLGNVTIVAVLLYGGTRVLDGEITVGVLAAFLLYLRRLFEPMQELSQFYNLFQAAAAALEKLSGVLDEEPSVPEPAQPVTLLDARGQVDFDRVTFRYRPDGPAVLRDLSLHIPAGQTVALVGATGAGKSTIARLVARFYDPVEGTVRLDGVDLRDLTEETLRSAVVTVTQENFLFSGTVAENIAFGRPDASREELEAAARAIGAHDFIAALPNGYDTDIRKRGGRLSAGQRQLVAFARAFLADPRVLILDEATSSLDIPSERLVQRALRTLLRDRTALIIAHRLSTVEIADRVLVLEDGAVVEDGPPSELLRRTGRYQRLHQAWADSLV